MSGLKKHINNNIVAMDQLSRQLDEPVEKAKIGNDPVISVCSMSLVMFYIWCVLFSV